MSEAAVRRGAVLRAWREFAGISASELARRIPVQRATLSMWESGERGRRAVPIEEVRRLAASLRLSELQRTAFVDMWRSAGSVTDGLPHVRWFHNFQSPNGPCWVWLRPRPGASQLQVHMWWGQPFQGRLERGHMTTGGLLVQFPTSIPNPPLQVTFDAPAWADFGVGVIPPRAAAALHAELIDARRILAPSDPVSPALYGEAAKELGGLFSQLRIIAERLGIAWSILAPHLGIAISRRLSHAIEGFTVGTTSAPADTRLDSRGYVATQLLVSSGQVRRMREARGLSRDAAAATATADDPAHPITDRMIENLEHTGRIPGVDALLTRLDHVYGYDGRLGLERIYDSDRFAALTRRGAHRISFPSYWVGPVWVQACGVQPGEDGVVDLRWGAWRRRQHVAGGTVLTTRRATPDAGPLIATIPSGWSIAAGTGVSPTATDINGGWWPVNLLAATTLLRDNLRIVRQAPTLLEWVGTERAHELPPARL